MSTKGLLRFITCGSVDDRKSTLIGRLLYKANMLLEDRLAARPDFPERFGSLQDARAFCRVFFTWYNTEHHHGGLGLLTPHDVHHGLAEPRRAARAAVLAAAYAAHPERFPCGGAAAGRVSQRRLDQSTPTPSDRGGAQTLKLMNPLSHSY